MNRNTYQSNLTEEDIRTADKKFPLADAPFKVFIFLILLTMVMFVTGIFFL